MSLDAIAVAPGHLHVQQQRAQQLQRRVGVAEGLDQARLALGGPEQARKRDSSIPLRATPRFGTGGCVQPTSTKAMTIKQPWIRIQIPS
jgi:hypothetical protein